TAAGAVLASLAPQQPGEIMPEPLAQMLVLALAGYAGLGAVFAAFFVGRGAGRLDPAAARGTWGFRALVFPATVALWPFLARRWWRAAGCPGPFAAGPAGCGQPGRSGWAASPSRPSRRARRAHAQRGTASACPRACTHPRAAREPWTQGRSDGPRL